MPKKEKNIDVLERLNKKAASKEPTLPERIDCDYCDSERSSVWQKEVSYSSPQEDIVNLPVRGYLCEFCGEATYSQESLVDVLQHKVNRDGKSYISISLSSSGKIRKRILH